jgi:phosphopantothenoylcysteine decarboxylase / phosphopantothenate---cysteine ligase
VTSGGTAEPIDGVRVLSNRSTGETGARIARYFARHGHEVTLLRAANAVAGGGGMREVTFESFADLDAALQRELQATAFDAIVHAAAVSDYSIGAIEIDGVAQPPGAGKLRSDVAPVLRLRTNPKLIATLRSRSSNPRVVVVGFKLTRGASRDEVERAVAALAANGVVDLVVHNDLTARRPDGTFPATLWRSGAGIVEQCADRADIAPALERQLFSAAATTRAVAAARDAAPASRAIS